jgi:hypothetical protein
LNALRTKEDVLRLWLRNTGDLLRDDDGKSNFGDRMKDLPSFLRSEVEGKEGSSIVKSGFRLSGDVARMEKRKEQVEQMAVMENDLLCGEKKKNSIACFSKDLKIVKTFKEQNLSVFNKQETLQNRKGCFSCLKPGHRSEHCSSQ